MEEKEKYLVKDAQKVECWPVIRGTDEDGESVLVRLDEVSGMETFGKRIHFRTKAGVITMSFDFAAKAIEKFDRIADLLMATHIEDL